MKKILTSSLVAVVLVVTASACTLDESPKKVLISQQDYERMSNIIIAVNKGQLPITALKDAELLLEKSPQLVSKETLKQYKAIQK